jgi:PAS domain S-box-containing protein
MLDSGMPSPTLAANDVPSSPFGAVFDASPVPMWIEEAGTRRVLAANGRALQQFGQDREQFLAAPPAAADGMLLHHRADGTVAALRLETSGIEVDARPARLVVAIDVSEEQAALAESEARGRDLLESAAEWTWQCDAELRLRHLSPEFAASTGLRPQGLLGRRLEESVGEAGAEEAWSAHRAATAARRRFRDFVFRAADGEGRRVWLKIGGTPVFDAGGAFQGYRGVGSNATAEVEAARALRRRDQRYARFFETGPVWFWEQDERYRFTYVSPNANSLLGIPPDQYLGRRLSDTPGVMIDPEIGRRALAAQAAREPYRDFIHARKLPDGTTVWASSSGAPIYDEDGTYRGYSGISVDVTARVEAENALRESERQFRRVLEAAADYYYETDAQYRLTYLSEAFEKVHGVPASQLLGKRQSEHPDIVIDPEHAKINLAAQRAKQPYRDFVYARRQPDGSKRWFKASGAPVFDRNGEFQGYRGIVAGITQEVEAEAVARLAQQRLHEAVAHVTQPIVVYDAEDRVVACNQAFAKLHDTDTPVGAAAIWRHDRSMRDVSFRELAEWQLRFGFYDEDAGDAVDLETLLARYQTDAEHSYHLRDGRWMLVVYRGLPGGGRVGLWTDVTALKRVESERRSFERQMHHAQRLEALGTLAGGIAHEINNALVPVIALTKLVAAKLPEGGRERRNLDTVLSGAERSRDLVRQILAFSRKEAEEPRRASIEVGAVLGEALRLMRATLPASIRVEEEIAPAPAITGDAGQLHQAIINVVTNAAQAIGQAQGRIAIRLGPEPDGAHLRLSIADSGCGMDEATRRRMFEPFFTTRSVGEGTGLGLAVVHGIVKDHGGRIEVASTPGEGTRLDIVLPAAPPPD